MATATRFPFYQALTLSGWQYKLWLYRVKNPAPFGTLPEIVEAAVQMPPYINFIEFGGIGLDFDLAADGAQGERVQNVKFKITDDNTGTWLRTNIFTNFAQSSNGSGGFDLYSYQLRLQTDKGTGVFKTVFWGEIDTRTLVFTPEYQTLQPFTTFSSTGLSTTITVNDASNLVIGQEIFYKNGITGATLPFVILGIAGTTLTTNIAVNAVTGEPLYKFTVKSVMECEAVDIQQYALQVQPFGDNRIYINGNYVPNSGIAIQGAQLNFAPTANGYLPPSQGKPVEGVMNNFNNTDIYLKYKYPEVWNPVQFMGSTFPEPHIHPPSILLTPSNNFLSPLPNGPDPTDGYLPMNVPFKWWIPVLVDDRAFASYYDILCQLTQSIANRMGWSLGAPIIDFSHLEYSYGGGWTIGSPVTYLPVAKVIAGASSTVQQLSNLNWNGFGIPQTLYFGATHDARTLEAYDTNLNEVTLDITITTTLGEIVYILLSSPLPVTTAQVGQFIPYQIFPALLALHRTELLTNQTYYRVQNAGFMSLFPFGDYSLANQGTAWDSFQLLKENFFHYSWLTFDDVNQIIHLNIGTPASSNLQFFGLDVDGNPHAPIPYNDEGQTKYAPLSFAARSVSVASMNSDTDTTQAATNAIPLPVINPPNQPLIPTQTINFSAALTNASTDVSLKLFLLTCATFPQGQENFTIDLYFGTPTGANFGTVSLHNQLTVFGIQGAGTVSSDVINSNIINIDIWNGHSGFSIANNLRNVLYISSMIGARTYNYVAITGVNIIGTQATLTLDQNVSVKAGTWVVNPDYSTDGSAGNVWCVDNNSNGIMTDASQETLAGPVKANLGVGGAIGNIDAGTQYSALTHADAMCRMLYSIFCGYTLTNTGIFDVTSKPLSYIYVDIPVDQYCPCYDGSTIDTRNIDTAQFSWILLWVNPIDGEQFCLITAVEYRIVNYKRYAHITAIYQPTA